MSIRLSTGSPRACLDSCRRAFRAPRRHRSPPTAGLPVVACRDSSPRRSQDLDVSLGVSARLPGFRSR
jgi:hypothetical protein